MNWHMRDARNNLSKLIREAIKNGPQTVTLRGKPTAVVLSAADYDRLKEKKLSFTEFILSGSKIDDDIVEAINWRDRQPNREVEF